MLFELVTQVRGVVGQAVERVLPEGPRALQVEQRVELPVLEEEADLLGERRVLGVAAAGLDEGAAEEVRQAQQLLGPFELTQVHGSK